MHIMWITLACLFPYFVVVVQGPSNWDRLLGVNLITTKILIIIITLASVYETTYLLDFAIIYALFGFIGVIFTALFLLQKTKGG